MSTEETIWLAIAVALGVAIPVVLGKWAIRIPMDEEPYEEV